MNQSNANHYLVSVHKVIAWCHSESFFDEESPEKKWDPSLHPENPGFRSGWHPQSLSTSFYVFYFKDRHYLRHNIQIT